MRTGPPAGLVQLAHYRAFCALSLSPSPVCLFFALYLESYHVVEDFCYSSFANFGHSFLYGEKSCLPWQRGGQSACQEVRDVARSEWVDKPTRGFAGLVDEFWSWCDRSIFMVRTQRLRAAVPRKQIDEHDQPVHTGYPHMKRASRPQVAVRRSNTANFARGGLIGVFFHGLRS